MEKKIKIQTFHIFFHQLINPLTVPHFKRQAKKNQFYLESKHQ